MSAILTGERAVASVKRDYAPWRVEWPDGTVIDGGGRDALISVDQACKARPGRPAEMVCTFPEVGADGCLHHWHLKARFLATPDGKVRAGEVWTPQSGWSMPPHAQPGLDLFRPLYYRIVDNRPAAGNVQRRARHRVYVFGWTAYAGVDVLTREHSHQVAAFHVTPRWSSSTDGAPRGYDVVLSDTP